MNLCMNMSWLQMKEKQIQVDKLYKQYLLLHYTVLDRKSSPGMNCMMNMMSNSLESKTYFH